MANNFYAPGAGLAGTANLGANYYNVPFSPFSDELRDPSMFGGATTPTEYTSDMGGLFSDGGDLGQAQTGGGGFFQQFPEEGGFGFKDFLDILGIINNLAAASGQQRLDEAQRDAIESNFQQTLAGIQKQIQDIQNNEQFNFLERDAQSLIDPMRAGTQRQSQAAQAQRLAQNAREKQAQSAAARGTTFSGQTREAEGGIEQQLAEALLRIQSQEAMQGRQQLQDVESRRQALLAPLFQQMAQIRGQRPFIDQRAQGINPYTQAGAALGGLFGGPGGALVGGGIGELAGRIF